jgi:heat shock protein HtpX
VPEARRVSSLQTPRPIQANRLCSAFLLALLFSLLGGTLDDVVADALRQFARSGPLTMIAALVWFMIAYFTRQSLIGMAIGAKSITRTQAPKLFNALEILCVARGIPMPALQIIEAPALNCLCLRFARGSLRGSGNAQPD